MNNQKILTKLNVSIFLIWLFHVSGIIGIIYTNASWFITATPINLLLSFFLLLINTKLNKNAFFMISTATEGFIFPQVKKSKLIIPFSGKV